MSTMLHVHRLSSRVTGPELHRLFEEAGRVIHCDVLTHGSNGSSKAIGFVVMATEEGAQNAIDQLNGKKLDGRVIFVSEGS